MAHLWLHPDSRLRLVFRPLILPALRELQLSEDLRVPRATRASVVTGADVVDETPHIDHAGQLLQATFGSALTTVSSKRPKGASVILTDEAQKPAAGSTENALRQVGVQANVVSRRSSLHTGALRRRSSLQRASQQSTAFLGRNDRRLSITATLLHTVTQPDQLFVLKENECTMLRARLKSIAQHTRAHLACMVVTFDRELQRKLEGIARDVETAIEILDAFLQLQPLWLFVMHHWQRDHSWRRLQQQKDPTLLSALTEADDTMRALLEQCTTYPQCHAMLDQPSEGPHLCGEDLRHRLGGLQIILERAAGKAWPHVQ